MSRLFYEAGRSDGGWEDYYEKDRKTNDYFLSLAFEFTFRHLWLGLNVAVWQQRFIIQLSTTFHFIILYSKDSITIIDNIIEIMIWVKGFIIIILLFYEINLHLCIGDLCSICLHTLWSHWLSLWDSLSQGNLCLWLRKVERRRISPTWRNYQSQFPQKTIQSFWSSRLHCSIGCWVCFWHREDRCCLRSCLREWRS